MTRRLLSIAFMLFGLPVAPAGAQDPQTGILYLNQLDFSRYPLVDLYMTAVDKNRKPLPIQSMDPAWLEISHKGVPVRPADIQSVMDLKQKGDSELYLALVFDNSASMQGRTSLLETAAAQFIDSLKRGDYVSLFDFGDGTISTQIAEFSEPVFARARTPFSNSKPFLRKNISTGLMTQRTFMYDALLFALSTLNTSNVLGRKAVILFSDGVDNGSNANAAHVQEVLRSSNIPVYGIDLNTAENQTLKNIAISSGGEYFFVRQVSDLAPLYQTILQLLKSQYRVSYPSPEATVSGDAYQVSVILTGPYVAQARKTFVVDGENIGFYNLVYLESTGGVSLRNYLDYLSSYPGSKHADQVRLRIGRYWQRRGEYAKALAVFGMILRNPTSAVFSEAMLEKAELHKTAKQFKAAQEAYNQVLNSPVSGSVRARALLELAKSYTAEGNFAMALNTYSTLSSQYEGTELASEAFLQSATLSMEMGDLPAATKNLEQVITNYGDSKTAVYARIELAKIAENEQNTEEAIRLYREVVASNVDSDIKDDLTLRLANLLKSSGNTGEAIGLYRSLIESSASQATVVAARQELLPALYQAGRVLEGRSLYEQLSQSAQSALASRFPTLPVTVDGSQGTALANGAYVLQSFGTTGPPPLSVIEWPEAAGKFSIVGPLYSLVGTPTPLLASLPVEGGWLERGLITPGTAGVYYFNRGNWDRVTNQYDARSNSYSFEYSNSGVYALLAGEPRVIRLFDIYFDLGKATIRKEGERNLYEVIDALKALPDVNLEIAGHTDSTGREEENIDLSSRRAQAIKDFMVLNGVGADRLIARGYGSQYPIVPNDSPENLQKNRRSEFTMISTLADPVQKSTGEGTRYTVLLREFRSVKDAYEEKRIYQGSGLPVAIVTTEEKAGGQYELTLGTYGTEEEAKEVVEKFKREFKNIEPRIISSKRTR